jgi:hypothetical protein
MTIRFRAIACLAQTNADHRTKIVASRTTEWHSHDCGLVAAPLGSDGSATVLSFDPNSPCSPLDFRRTAHAQSLAPDDGFAHSTGGHGPASRARRDSVLDRACAQIGPISVTKPR